MPAAATHVEFGNDLLSALPRSLVKKVTDMPMFWIGTQGPDILFFSRMSIIPGSLHKYGNILHEKYIREQFVFLTQYVKNNPHLESYLIGYICHYALDANAHALICSIAKEVNRKKGLPVGTTHVRIESEIDAWITNQKGRNKYKEIWKSMQLSLEDRKELALMYHNLFLTVYNMDIPIKRFQHALYELSIWTPIIRPRYIGRTITFGGEFLIGAPRSTKNMILHAAHPKEGLNLEHKAYPCFYDNTQTISTSFPDLYDESLILAYKMIKHFSITDLHTNFMGEPIDC